MESWIEEVEELVHSGRIKVPYTWSVGETGSHFFVTLRDEKRILGTRCSRCSITFLPPRKICPRCFSPEMSWKELGHQGTLLTFTTPRYRERIHPIEGPFAYGIVRLDGADTGLTHLIAGFEEGSLQSGMRVEAVFREAREGNILDIQYFRPVR